VADEPREAGAFIAQVVNNEFALEDSRRISVEQRGVAVVTSSGALATLMLGLAALVTKAADFKLKPFPLALLLIALALFMLAAARGILANQPVKHQRVDLDDLSTLVEDLEVWRKPAEAVDRPLTEARLNSLRAIQRQTNRKVSHLTWGLRSEMAALVFLAAGVVVILVGR
jgi:hypothetical protein